MEDMLKEFVVEAMELATQVEDHLLTLERQPDDMETINAVFRSFHTIKGGAGFMNLQAMVEACHLTENLFDALRNGKAPVTPEAIEAALQASSFVAFQLDELMNGTAPESLSSLPGNIGKILVSAIEGGNAAAPNTPEKKPADKPDVSGGPDWEALYRAVVPPGTIADPVDDAAPAQEEDGTVSAASGDSDDHKRTEGSTPEAPERRRNNTNSIKDDSIRIDAVKLDSLLEVAGEAVQAANQASVLLEKLLQFKFDDSASDIIAHLIETQTRASRYSTELQRATLSTRMQPVGRLFQRFPRLVRELAKELGKNVELVIEGAETEVDRVVVDSLYDPLVHMLRNSLDHGVEPPEGRLAAGKPEKAVISLRAWQEASSVMIEVADDGRGMDPQKLRDKAISKGLIDPSAALTPDEAYQLVFLPGFSTMEVASSVSGRGVGMDVVRTAVEKHRGSIWIASELGVGTRFSIRLPIELSIVPTMLVTTSGSILGIPMSLVQRVVELPDTFAEVGGQPVFRDQGRPLPVLSLAGVLGYDPSNEKAGIVIAAPNPYILAVETLDGTADLVIKPLTALDVPGISGTARSAEGRLVLVVGLSFLLDGCRMSAHSAPLHA